MKIGISCILLSLVVNCTKRIWLNPNEIKVNSSFLRLYPVYNNIFVIFLVLSISYPKCSNKQMQSGTNKRTNVETLTRKTVFFSFFVVIFVVCLDKVCVFMCIQKKGKKKKKMLVSNENSFINL